MSQISASHVKELREKTGAGMLDCRKALEQSSGDLEAAVDWLRTKGLAAAAKKSGRVAAEGLVGVAAGDKAGAMVEVNSETDFVARNEQFQALTRDLAQLALAGHADVESLASASMPNGAGTAKEAITSLIATIGENMTLRRVARLQVQSGVVATYMHAALAPNLGKIGVLVALESPAPAEKLAGLGRQLAMHIAAARPEVLSIADVDPASLDRERAVLTEQASDSGKPPEVIAKMVEGRLRKYYEEVVLLEQVYVVDGETKVSKVVEAAAKELGQPVAIAGFARFALGEGIEKDTGDFAAEVAAQLAR